MQWKVKMEYKVEYDLAKLYYQRFKFREYRFLLRWTKHNRHKLPYGVPSDPKHHYPEEYEGDKEFLGERPPLIMPYDLAKKFVRHVGIKSHAEYVKYIRDSKQTKKPCMRLPACLYTTYGKEFEGYAAFLGTNNMNSVQRRKQFLPFEKARAYMHQQGLKNFEEWWEWNKAGGPRPSYIPFNPEDTYKGKYKGIKDWIGSDIVSRVEVKRDVVVPFVIFRDPEDPPQVYCYATFAGGVREATQKCSEFNYDIIAMYEYDSSVATDVMNVIRHYGKDYGNNSFLVRNLYDITYELGMLANTIKNVRDGW